MNVFEKWIKVFLHPTEFFNEIKAESDYVPSIIFSYVTYALTSLPATLLSSFLLLGILGLSLQFFGIIFNLITLVIGLFIGAGIVHLLLMIIGAKDFLATFKAICYSSGVNSAYVWPITIAIALFIGSPDKILTLLMALDSKFLIGILVILVICMIGAIHS